MIELKGNLFDFDGDAIFITTNGVIKHNGHLVMGAGVAKAAVMRHEWMPKVCGETVCDRGSGVYHWPVDDSTYENIGIFPTKHHWRDDSCLDLIERSARQLVDLADDMGWQRVGLPRPGCGRGGLKWGDVKAVIERLFDDRFYIVDRAK